MKRLLNMLLTATAMVTTVSAIAQQDKSKRPSPPAKISVTLAKGGTITIDYSQPSVKGRTIGKEIAPYGQVWRTGANEATTFETTKELTIEGKKLPKGKYSLYTIPGEKEWTVILNKTWKQWGTVYNEKEDEMRFTTKPLTNKDFVEQMTFNVSKEGKVSLTWGNLLVAFMVQ